MTKNLADALSFLRDEGSARTLWIDALCINQTDLVEKGQQVRKMHRIYEHAYQVLVWLGVPSQESDSALAFATQIYYCFRSDDVEPKETYEVQEYGDKADRIAASRHLIHAEYAGAWIALNKLLSLQWWSRAWVLQELILAKRAVVVYGKMSATWPVVNCAILIFASTWSLVKTLMKSAMPSIDVVLGGQALQRAVKIAHGRMIKRKHGEDVLLSPWLTSYFLDMSRSRSCKLQHDKVYSVLGLVSSTVYDAVSAPNYNRSFQYVYKQIFKAYVQGIGDLVLLCYSQHTDTQDDLPSWVPDWRRGERMTVLCPDGRQEESGRLEKSWHSVAIRRQPPHFSGDLSTLVVSGICLSVIQRTQLEHQLVPNLWKVSQNVWQFEAGARDLLHHALKEIPSMFAYRPENQLQDTTRLLLAMLRLRRDTKGYSQTQLGELPEILRNGSSEFTELYDNMKIVTDSRTVIEMEDLKLGLAPLWTLPGDVVCQIVGCNIPIVLRRQSDGNYKFIGECYVHGYMDGEMIEVLEKAIAAPEGHERFNLI